MLIQPYQSCVDTGLVGFRKEIGSTSTRSCFYITISGAEKYPQFPVGSEHPLQTIIDLFRADGVIKRPGGKKEITVKKEEKGKETALPTRSLDKRDFEGSIENLTKRVHDVYLATVGGSLIGRFKSTGKVLNPAYRLTYLDLFKNYKKSAPELIIKTLTDKHHFERIDKEKYAMIADVSFPAGIENPIIKEIGEGSEPATGTRPASAASGVASAA